MGVGHAGQGPVGHAQPDHPLHIGSGVPKGGFQREQGNLGVLYNVVDRQPVYLPLGRVGEKVAEGVAQFFQAVPAGELGGVGEPLQVFVVAVVDPVQDVLLGLEVVVDGPLGHAQGVHNVLDGGVLVALLGEQAHGHVQNFGHGLLWMLVAGHGAPSFAYIPSVCLK